MLAELLTITEVMGNPPKKPAARLPIPWALSSRLGEVYLLSGSNLSVASMQSKVSMEATTAMIIPNFQTSGFKKPFMAGKENKLKNSEAESVTGRFTRLLALKYMGLPDERNI